MNSFSISINNPPRPAELITLPSRMEVHDHHYAQVVIGLKGEAKFEINGIQEIIGPGRGCIVAADLDHGFGGITGESDILVLNMPLPSNQDPLLLQKINELSNRNCYFQLDKQIQILVQLLIQEMRSNPDDLLLSRACNDTIIALLQRHIATFKLHDRTSRFELEVIDRYIDQHIGRKISIAQLAGSVFLGESQFHHLFKMQVGLTPHQYLLNKRIEMAKLLIEQGTLNLGQVAELTGFSGQSSFYHAFTRLQGMTPSQYKKWLTKQ